MDDRRQRRKGYRPGVMAEPVRAALEALGREFDEVADPAERVRVIGDFFAAMDVELESFVAMRFDAIAELRARRMTYDQIAAVTGLSKARVAQLARQTSDVSDELGDDSRAGIGSPPPAS